jgi:GMP synthase (glutamine-hydrolysing)
VPTLLALIHASWERPHRILDAFEGVEVIEVEALAGDSLPPHSEVGGVVAMGGPMNVDDIGRYPALATERVWLAGAVEREMPLLGICLGAQLLARALGAAVRPGAEPEIGFAPVEIHDATDPIVGALAPETTVLHWHGDVFDLPPGAQPLASSAQTEHQAFRAGNAWGLLFHPEGDAALVDSWLAAPEMAAEARDALGEAGIEALSIRALEVEDDLMRSSAPGFHAFAELVKSR